MRGGGGGVETCSTPDGAASFDLLSSDPVLDTVTGRGVRKASPLTAVLPSSFMLLFFGRIPCVVLVLLLQLSPFRNSDPSVWSHSGHTSPFLTYGACNRFS